MTQSNNKPTLLPFLAVLLCTMGALIMLLVLIVRDVREPEMTRQKKVGVAKTQSIKQPTLAPLSKSDLTPDSNSTKKFLSAADAKEALENLKLDTAEAEWLAKEFSASKNELEKQLANDEAYLASVEKQTIRFREEIKRLLELAGKIEQDGGNKNEVNVKTLEQLLKQKIEQQTTAEKRLAELQKELKNKAKSYAIVPYRGTNGTFRAPIYVECKDNKVIIQPEGIELTAYDFLAIDRADNPFDSLLRVARQYYAETGQIERGTEPYPLIIIRPSGIHAFEAAYAAMGNWLRDYGYELVAEDWKMEYPKQNNELRNRMEKQLVISRQRLQGYVAAMKLKNGSGDLHVMKNANPNKPNSQNQYNGNNNQNDQNKKNNNPNNVTNNKQNRQGDGNTKREYTISNGIVHEIGSSDTAPRLGKTDSKTGVGTNSDRITTQNEIVRNETNNLENNNSNGNFRNNNNNSIFSDNNLNYPYSVNSVPNNLIANKYISDNPLRNSQNTNSQNTNSVPNISQTNLLQDPIKTLPPTSTAPESNNTIKTTPPIQNSDQNPTKNSSQNLLSSSSHEPSPFEQINQSAGAGQHSATPDAVGNHGLRTFSSPIRRNIKIYVGVDRFIIGQQVGFDTPKTIMIEHSTQKSVSVLIKAIADFVETWGIAGERFYWLPVLKVKILNGGEYQFKELQRIIKENKINILIENE